MNVYTRIVLIVCEIKKIRNYIYIYIPVVVFMNITLSSPRALV